ncbi:MAG TPA: DUF1109 domain-containing protein [Geminicoccus sp.]|jgi:hypothetical protein|uniref:DUF1109 domain-containing protein n=1 Tax=Geminicoccus sp. TaxID=2024832 RepID=UPI002E36C625|nr:DUF1109 domain-containing protein [Geminicoccus sp.]HEX2525890.1 DUF1109 domain-containing protein [Geminicoccus sp.]
MNTPELIDLLVADREVHRPSSWSLPSAVLIGFATALLLTALVLGLRPMGVLASLPVLGKLAFALGLGLLTLPSLLRMLRPGAPVGRRLCLPLAAVAVLLAAAAYQLLSGPAPPLWRNETLWCLVMVPLFALPGFVLLGHAARMQAPTDLPRTGLMVGLLAGTLSAAAYALHCPNDDPLYLVTAYLPALVITTLIGRALGPRILAW